MLSQLPVNWKINCSVQDLALSHWYKRGLRQAGRVAAVPGSCSWASRDLITTVSWLSYQTWAAARLPAQAAPGAAVAVPFPTPAWQGVTEITAYQGKTFRHRAEVWWLWWSECWLSFVCQAVLAAWHVPPLSAWSPFIQSHFQVKIPEGQTLLFWIIQPVSAFHSEGSGPCQQTHL